MSLRQSLFLAVIFGALALAGCSKAEELPAGPGAVPVEQWGDAVKVTKAAWDGNRTLTLTVEGDLAKAADLAPIIVWGYVKHSLPTGAFEMPLPSGRKLKVGTLSTVGLEDTPPLDQLSAVQHQVAFVPFQDAADPAKGGVLEFVATTLRESRTPQTFALALPVYRARGRMDWFGVPVQDLRPVLILPAPPLQGAKLPDDWRLGVEDLPPDPPAK